MEDYRMVPKKVEKSWGWEYIFVNNDLYCGKLMYIEPGVWSSKGKFHYHKNKDETFFVTEGFLILQVIENNKIKTLNLPPFTTYRIGPFERHRFITHSILGCKFIEVSTHHEDSDSYYEDNL